MSADPAKVEEEEPKDVGKYNKSSNSIQAVFTSHLKVPSDWWRGLVDSTWLQTSNPAILIL